MESLKEKWNVKTPQKLYRSFSYVKIHTKNKMEYSSKNNDSEGFDFLGLKIYDSRFYPIHFCYKNSIGFRNEILLLLLHCNAKGIS